MSTARSFNTIDPVFFKPNGDENTYFLTLDFTAFIGAYSGSRSVGVTLHRDALPRLDLKSVVQQFAHVLNTPASTLTFKVIASNTMLVSLHSHFKSLGLIVEKEVCCDDNGTKIIFEPDIARLRIERSSKRSEGVKPLRVLIVDDDKTMCMILNGLFERSSRLEVVGLIHNPLKVEEEVQRLQPDIITLDLNMPHMNGAEVVDLLMKKYSIPIVMITATSIADGHLVMDALDNGAVDYIQKPDAKTLRENYEQINEKIKLAASIRPRRQQRVQQVRPVVSSSGLQHKNRKKGDVGLIVIGSSTGGTQALQQILTALPGDMPPIAIVQHIPPVFSRALADRLNGLCALDIFEASDGQILEPGMVAIAPGDRQMRLAMHGDEFKIVVNDDPALNRHRPSVDYLFDSVTTLRNPKGGRTMAVMLTGMGKDGAKAMLEMRNNGATTLGQNENSCTVYGMPKAAFEIGAVETQVSLELMAKAIVDRLKK